MGDLSLITYCGLYYPLCAKWGPIPRQASVPKEASP